ncbi:hypothetical protein LTR17_014074 [Elasticomyces elasticus]|nr:hypothetical protein LTR17_014074 [Elasticomyces elasticus]
MQPGKVYGRVPELGWESMLTPLQAVRWLVKKPQQKALRAGAMFTETVARDSAAKLGFDAVDIRAGPHTTTTRNGIRVPIQNHITLNWLAAEGEGKLEKKKEGELFLDEDSTRVLEGHELDENTKELNKTAEDVNSNPHVWASKNKE